MINLIIYLGLLAYSYGQLNKTSNEFDDNLICRILNEERIANYLHLDQQDGVDTIKFYGQTTFFDSCKQGTSCLNKTVKFYNNQDCSAAKPLEFNILKFNTEANCYKMRIEYKLEGIAINVVIPKVANRKKEISVEIIEH